MNFKPNEEDWMAYLYDELGADDRERFEAYLQSDATAREKLKRFQHMRGLLASVEDQEVIPPSRVMDATRHRATRQRFRESSAVRTVTSLAAAVLLVILVGKLAGMTLSVSGKTITLSFGAMPAPAAPSAQEVQQMIDASLAQNGVRMEARLSNTQRELEASIRETLATRSAGIEELLRQTSTASKQEIRRFAETLQEQNQAQVQQYFQLTSADQRAYIENLLVDFAKYLQQQRNDDLQVMQLQLNNLEQHNAAFRVETEQILASIMTSVGGPRPDERMN